MIPRYPMPTSGSGPKCRQVYHMDHGQRGQRQRAHPARPQPRPDPAATGQYGQTLVSSVGWPPQARQRRTGMIGVPFNDENG